jgi:hypothetical protein
VSAVPPPVRARVEAILSRAARRLLAEEQEEARLRGLGDPLEFENFEAREAVAGSTDEWAAMTAEAIARGYEQRRREEGAV